MHAGTRNAAIALSALVQASAAAQPVLAPETVLTDTPEYCVTLREQVDRMSPSAPDVVLSEVRVLESEGRRLCDSGETRGGILRLRRAIMAMMHASRDQAESGER